MRHKKPGEKLVIKRWKQLLDHLDINEAHVTKENIGSLLAWCRENISAEVEFSGDVKEQFFALKKYLSEFLEATSAYTRKSDRLAQPQAVLGGMNLIQFAALKGYDRYLEQLLGERVDIECSVLVNTGTKTAEMTPLHLSAYRGHRITSEVLLRFGADRTRLSRQKQTPLHLSLIIPSGSTDAVKARKIEIFNLLKTPETILLKDKAGFSVSHLIAQNGFTVLMEDLAKEIPGSLGDGDGLHRSSLHIAILNRHPEMTQFLVSFPDLLNIEDNEGKTPVHYAAFSGEKYLLELCVNSRNDKSTIDTPDAYNRTAMHFAALSGHIELVVFLSSKGASTSYQDNSGFTALFYAAMSGKFDVVHWLCESTSVDVDHQDLRGRTVVMSLLENTDQFTPETEQLLRYLIMEKKCDLSIEDNDHQTAKDYAKKLMGKVEISSDDIFSEIMKGKCDSIVC